MLDDASTFVGFDAVIGNPLYVQIQNIPAPIKNILGGQGYSTYARTADLYCLFYERDGNLLGQQSTLSEHGWSLSCVASASTLEKMCAAGSPLGEYVKGEIYYGIKTGFNEAFILTAQQRDALIAADIQVLTVETSCRSCRGRLLSTSSPGPA